MKQLRFIFINLMVVVLFATSCKKDDETTVAINEAEVVAKYLESADSPAKKDFVNTDMPTIIAATDVKTINETNQAYIIDIRSAADYALGHIKNAKNVAVEDVLTHVKAADLTPYSKLVVVCYTGQTASYVTTLLRLMGYDKAVSLKWGMCSWHADFASKWNTTIAAGNAYAAQFTATVTDKAAKGNLPTLATGKTTGQDILETRVAALLKEGFTPASVTNATVFGNLSGYYIVNYWPAAQYADPGHIPGAVQYTPKETMKFDVDLKTLPTDKPIAVYCYTGQTSAALVAYLRLLGYDAKTILYGTNGMIYDKMKEKAMTIFSATEIKGYDFVK